MIYFLLFVFLLIFELAYFRLAAYYRIQDKPNNRSSHRKPTLLGGGVLFIVAVLVYSIYFGFNYPWMFLGAALLATVSFVDDVRPLSPRFRLLIHFLSLAIMFFELDFYSMSFFWLIPAIILTAGVLNAYNFMDGINGMMGVTSMVVLLGMIYINAQVIAFVDVNLLYTLLIAVLIFNYFNFRKNAYCFAGDVGAFTMGFVVVFLIIKLIAASGNFAWIALLAMFGVDTILTIVHRIFLKEKITHAHRIHLFQILANELKIPQLLISTAYGLIQAVVIVGLIVLEDYSCVFASGAILLLSLLYIVVKFRYFHLHSSNKELQQNF